MTQIADTNINGTDQTPNEYSEADVIISTSENIKNAENSTISFM